MRRVPSSSLLKFYNVLILNRNNHKPTSSEFHLSMKVAYICQQLNLQVKFICYDGKSKMGLELAHI